MPKPTEKFPTLFSSLRPEKNFEIYKSLIKQDNNLSYSLQATEVINLARMEIQIDKILTYDGYPSSLLRSKKSDVSFPDRVIEF